MDLVKAIDLEFEKMETTDPYYQRNKEMMEYIYSLIEVNDKLEQGPLQYVSKEENLKLVKDFFCKYYPKEAKNISSLLDENVFILSEDEVKKIIANEACFEEYPQVVSLFAEHLFVSPAFLVRYQDTWAILSKESDSLNLAFSLVHEYTHKIHYDKAEMTGKEFLVKTEAISFYNEFLFKDFLKNTKYQHEAEMISSREKYQKLDTMAFARDCYKIKNRDESSIEKQNLYTIGFNLSFDVFYPSDYKHGLGYVFANELYNKDISLEEKADKLVEIMSNEEVKAEFQNKDKGKVKSLVRNILQNP